MAVIDPTTEQAVRDFMRRIPADLRVERALLFGSRARGDFDEESDADVALVLREGGDDWRVLWRLAGVAWQVFVETGIYIQPVPISSEDWADPKRVLRPSFLLSIKREGISL